MKIRSVIVALSAILMMAACQAGPRRSSPTDVMTTTTVPATTTTTVPIGAAISGFEDCMREGGVAIPEIPLDAEGRPRLELVMAGIDFSRPDVVAALTECSGHLAGGPLDLSLWPALQQRVQAALDEFSECVRSHGVLAFPDPVSGFTGVGGPFPLEEIPFDDPNLEAAVVICRDRLTAKSS